MKGRLWKDLAQFLGFKEDGEGHFGLIQGLIQGFETDSRKVKEGMIFVALKGERVDGHDFLEEAAQNGAIGALVSNTYTGNSFGLPLISLDNVLGSVQKLAQAVHEERKGKTVAITGSVGKTTTKEFVATLLEGRYRVAKTLGNANSQVGIPLSILNWGGEADVFVFEMGMSEPGQIKKLTEIAPPDMALLTKVGVSHAAFFEEGIEGIAAAKSEIFSHSKTRLAIINGQAIDFKSIQKLEKEKIYFGEQSSAFTWDYGFKKVKEGVIIEELGKTSPLITLPFEASHLLENFCAAVVVARSLGLEWEEIAKQATLLRPFKRRFEKVEKEGIIYLNDSYNASPESMRAALMNLPVPSLGKKRIAVLGEMKELGMYAEKGHREVAEFALNHVDYLVCFGKGCLPMVEIFREKKRPVEYFEEFPQMQKRLVQLMEKGDVVLLKGSHSNALWRLVEEVQ